MKRNETLIREYKIRRWIFLFFINLFIAIGLALLITAAMFLHAWGLFFMSSLFIVIVISMSFFWLVWLYKAKSDIDSTSEADFKGI
jgi:hypothetical protein